MFLKVISAIVIAFFALLWATGSDLNSLKYDLRHWADGAAQQRSSDWGR